MGVVQEIRLLLKPAATGAVFGCILYFAADTASDIYTFCIVRRQALERVRQSPEVAQLVGEPYRAGPWYDGTLGFSHRDHVAHCTFQITGSARTTDIVARASRQPGLKLNFLYNAFGAGTWDLVTCQAMFPGAGGLAQPRNLMEPLPVVAKKQAKAMAAADGSAECLPCKQQAAQQQQRQQAQQQVAAAAAAPASERQQQQWQQQQQSPRRWWWWWGSGSSSSSGGGGGGGGSSSSDASSAGSDAREPAAS